MQFFLLLNTLQVLEAVTIPLGSQHILGSQLDDSLIADLQVFSERLNDVKKEALQQGYEGLVLKPIMTLGEADAELQVLEALLLPEQSGFRFTGISDSDGDGEDSDDGDDDDSGSDSEDGTSNEPKSSSIISSDPKREDIYSANAIVDVANDLTEAATGIPNMTGKERTETDIDEEKRIMSGIFPQPMVDAMFNGDDASDE